MGTKEKPHLLKPRVDITSEEVTKYSELIKELKDILTWNYKDILGIDPKLVVYNFLLKANANQHQLGIGRIFILCNVLLLGKDSLLLRI